MKILLRLGRYLTIAGCCAFAPIGCEHRTDAAKPKTEPVAVTLASSRVQDLPRTVDVVGTLFGDEEATISAKVAGRISAVQVDIGDRVDAAAMLAQIEQADYELAVRQAEMALQQTLAKLGLQAMPSPDFDVNSVPTVRQAKVQAANAAAKLSRVKLLREQNSSAVGDQDYADLETAGDVARSVLDVAILNARTTVAEAHARETDVKVQQRKLSDTALRAPETRDGGPKQYAVIARLVSAGEYVKEGTPAFRVVAEDPIRFRASIPERYLAEVKVGQNVAVWVEAYADAFAGIVKRINPQVDPASRAFAVEIAIPNTKGLLRPGAFARGTISTRVEPNVTLVPQAAVVTFAGVRKVFTVKDGKAAENEVTIGQKLGDYVEIVKGIKGKQDIVVSGANRLSTGTPVQTNAIPSTQP